MDVKKLIGLRVKELRRSGGMSQEVLAEKTGISSKYLSSIERGKENPTLDTFINLAKALTIELLEIFNFSHEEKSTEALKEYLSLQINESDEERLKLAAKILKEIYL